jgi:hypothetical protein
MSKLLCGALVAVSLILGFADTAAAKFSSVGEGSSGSGESIELELEAGGAKVSCAAFKEGSSKIAWTIEEGGKAASEGEDLRMLFESWGECEGSSSEISKQKATISSCKLQVAEPKSEGEVTEQVVSTCTIKLASCEIKILPEENKALSATGLFNSGIENEDLDLNLEAKNLATTISGTCPGIKATKAGTIVDIAETKQVQPGRLSEFRIGASPNAMPGNFRSPAFFLINEAALITVANVGVAQAPLEWGIVARPPASLSRNMAQESTCATHLYGANCVFAFEFVNPGSVRWVVADANNVRAEVVPRT